MWHYVGGEGHPHDHGVLAAGVFGNGTWLLGGRVGAVTRVALNARLNRLTANSPTAKRLFGDAPRRSATVAAPSQRGYIRVYPLS